MTAQTFGRRLAQLREDAGLNRNQLARLAGTDAIHVTRLERGERSPSLATAIRLARALGVGLAEFDTDPTQETRP